MKIKNIGKLKTYKIKEFKPVIEKCKNCGSKLELDKNDIEEHLLQTSSDGKIYYPQFSKFVCPICFHKQVVSNKNFEKYKRYIFVNKIIENIKELEENDE